MKAEGYVVSKRVGFGTKRAANEIGACAVPFCCPIMQGMKYGYARVSSVEQNLDLQLAALRRAKCAHIFEEKLSGKTASNRPTLTPVSRRYAPATR